MSQSSNGGCCGCGSITVPSALGITFVVLKLCHAIEWEWVWVLAPFWIPLAMFLCAAAILLLFGLLFGAGD